MRTVPIALIAACLLALTACSSGDEAADETATPDEPIAGEPGDGAPAFDASIDSESEPGEDGRRWFYKTASQSALYGPPDSEGMLTLRCDIAESGAKDVLVNWFTPGAVAGEERVLEIRSGGDTERVDVTGVEAGLGGGTMWRGRLAPEASQASLLLETDDQISLRLDDGEDYSISVPTAEQMRQVIRACRVPGTGAD